MAEVGHFQMRIHGKQCVRLQKATNYIPIKYAMLVKHFVNIHGGRALGGEFFEVPPNHALRLPRLLF